MSNTESQIKPEIRAKRNDALRKSLQVFPMPETHYHLITCMPRFKVAMAHSVAVSSPELITWLVGAVRDDDEFTPDNNPYGEHDFGAVTHPETKEVYFWKIDETEVGTVITLMHSRDY